jgi:hypothetical protein
VLQPTKSSWFKTAKALGLIAIPESLLLRADELIA